MRFPIFRRGQQAIPLLFAALPVWGAACGDLARLDLPHAAITAAELAPATHVCRVTATLKPTGDSEIRIEVRMPESGWNGKFEAVGNGGWSGAINTNGMTSATTAGYASASTDTGHEGGSAKFALGHPEKLIDYAYRSEHEMTIAAKAIVTAYYGKGPRLSYWNGCSAGGKQGLKEAQKYPADYDGIIAGSPAANWTGRAAQSIWVQQVLRSEVGSYIPPEKYKAIHRAVLAACDELDGVKDGVIENPLACKFDPAVLLCQDGDSVECLTEKQIAAARRIYAPSVNPRNGQRLYAGLSPGSEPGWAIWGGANPLSIGLDYFRYVVFENPDWDWRSLNFGRDIARAEELDHDRIDALDPNLKPFFARGGKLIQYHGWSDPQISPGNSVDYYRSVVERLGSVDASYRLFMVPGMAHCGGGEGATSFNALPVLEEWVEQKKAPARIIAQRDQWTHPLCPFPQVAAYIGKGDPKDAANYVCRKP